MDLKDNQFTNTFLGITKTNRVIAIIVSIALIVLGIFGFVYPLAEVAILVLIAGIALIAFGAYKIIVFAIGKTGRSSLTLIGGIIAAIIGLLLVITPDGQLGGSGEIAAVDGAIYKLIIFAIFTCIFLLVDGIGKFCSIPAAKAANAPYGLLILCGILDTILAIFMIVSPFLMTGIFGILIAIYFIIGGTCLLVDACARPTAE